MTDNELISTLQTLLQPIQDKLESIEIKVDGLESKVDNLESKVEANRKEIKGLKDDMELLKIETKLTHRKLDDLTLDTKVAERSIRKDIAQLQDAQETVITVLEHKNILPKAE